MKPRSRKFKIQVWLIAAICCIILSMLADFLAGMTTGMVNFVCPNRKHIVGMLFMCQKPGRSEIGGMLMWIIDEFSQCSGLPFGHLPVWIVGSQLLMFCGFVASLLTLIVLIGYCYVPPPLALSIADGLAVACFSSAAFHGASLVNLGSGLANDHLTHEIFTSCTVLHDEHHTYSHIMVASTSLLCLSGAFCLLAQILEGKLHHQRKYEAYIKEIQHTPRKARTKLGAKERKRPIETKIPQMQISTYL